MGGRDRGEGRGYFADLNLIPTFLNFVVWNIKRHKDFETKYTAEKIILTCNIAKFLWPSCTKYNLPQSNFQIHACCTALPGPACQLILSLYFSFLICGFPSWQLDFSAAHIPCRLEIVDPSFTAAKFV